MKRDTILIIVGTVLASAAWIVIWWLVVIGMALNNDGRIGIRVNSLGAWEPIMDIVALVVTLGGILYTGAMLFTRRWEIH